MELFATPGTVETSNFPISSDFILRKKTEANFLHSTAENVVVKPENAVSLTESRNFTKLTQELDQNIVPALMIHCSSSSKESSPKSLSENTFDKNKVTDAKNNANSDSYMNAVLHTQSNNSIIINNSATGNNNNNSNNNNNNNNNNNDNNNNSDNLPWEYDSCNSSCLRILNRPSVVLSLLCISSFLKGFILNGIINVNMSTIEKRFGLTSSQAGWIASVHDITAAPVALFVSFIGAVGYKMRWIGFGLFCLSIGSFIIIMPHFAAGEYKWQHNFTGLCSNKTNLSAASDTDTSNLLYVFLLGRLIHGIGCSILHTLGISCVDDCVDPKNAPMYMGIMLCFGTLGPAFGFLIGGEFLKIFVNVNSSDILFSEEDPQWIGAWWLSFLVSAVIALLIVPLMLAYKKELPVSKKIENSCSEVHQNTSQKRLAQFGFGSKVKDLPVTAYLLLWNPSFLFVTLTFTTEAALLHGVTTFLPKYLESQYQRTPSQASLLTGIIAVPGGAGGQLLGGYICKRFGLKINQMTRLAIVCFVVSLTTWSVVWIKCDGSVLADITGKNENRRFFTRSIAVRKSPRPILPYMEAR
ncbi:solute carrier organic anion transporter family member 4A1 [Octopus bimaculoides]|uniref:solute carrier organic anion transporter family member 4A1 n=1 Tax=Octopus bimaculoides TaxID=37653 RepID=UPI0022E61E22|nr:solute carrier organic anion transporter family member 4A1 [Octopus bimaculoides]